MRTFSIMFWKRAVSIITIPPIARSNGCTRVPHLSTRYPVPMLRPEVLPRGPEYRWPSIEHTAEDGVEIAVRMHGSIEE
jgi:hypothetical protein